ncbi:uncharacterized protein An11g08730 [Aspergillus niger]|uniref:Contig An11c0280, genomic contig n=2 Tax=Aspergillus niger TaxID=5061 RepID=A2QXF1_ASPNC|nr:uncharacterized protein An11g08730 [Aspergillus niger]CAK46059.1 unnamed protein product [Aspergillus niger]
MTCDKYMTDQKTLSSWFEKWYKHQRTKKFPNLQPLYLFVFPLVCEKSRGGAGTMIERSTRNVRIQRKYVGHITESNLTVDGKRIRMRQGCFQGIEEFDNDGLLARHSRANLDLDDSSNETYSSMIFTRQDCLLLTRIQGHTGCLTPTLSNHDLAYCIAPEWEEPPRKSFWVLDMETMSYGGKMKNTVEVYAERPKEWAAPILDTVFREQNGNRLAHDSEKAKQNMMLH